MPAQGSRRAAGVLRLSGRALAASAHDQSDRVDVRDHSPSHQEDQELRERKKRVELDASTCHERAEAMAPTARVPSVCGRDCQREVHRWNRREDRKGSRVTRLPRTQYLTVTLSRIQYCVPPLARWCHRTNHFNASTTMSYSSLDTSRSSWFFG